MRIFEQDQSIYSEERCTYTLDVSHSNKALNQFTVVDTNINETLSLSPADFMLLQKNNCHI